MKTRILMLTAGAVLAAPAAGLGAGTTSVPFLLQEPTARVTAMGGAAAALYDEAGAAYFNPAGLGYAPGHRLSFSAWNGVDGESSDSFLSATFKTAGAGAFSLSYLRHSSGKEDIYDLGGSLSSVELAREFAFSAGWGRELGRNLAAGAQVKLVRSELAEAYADKTGTFDAGLMLKTNNGRLTLGAGVQNAAGRLRYMSDADPLPRLFYGGAAFRIPAGTGKLLLAADLHKPRDRDGGDIHAGLEYGVNLLALRLGVRRVAGENAFTAGGGIRFRQFSFDYGFQAAGELDQPLHKFAFSVLLDAPGAKMKPAPEAQTKVLPKDSYEDLITGPEPQLLVQDEPVAQPPPAGPAAPLGLPEAPAMPQF